ncbi:MAG: 2-phospho-L-lactate guanylyltransferase [Thermoleophilia bacterium]
MSGGGTWAVLPVKPLRGALRRLTPALDAPVRRELQVAMLTDVLAACAGAHALAGVMVVTSDPAARGMAEAIAGARVVSDEPPRGMNAAVVRGLEAVAAAGADGALVLTADLPLARPEDLDAVVAAAPPGPSGTVAPSWDGTGTNAMLLRPPGALTPRLGVDSLARHLAQAARRGVPVTRLDLPTLALDIDTPRDLAELMARGGGGATLAACARLDIAGLLAGSPAVSAR